MESTSAERVRRLVRWLKAHKPESLASDGEPTPAWLAQSAGRSVSYWSDVLRIPNGSGKSFGDKAARELEDKLKMPQLHLEGAGWPFETIDQDRFESLTERQKGRIEQMLADALAKVEAERPTAASNAAALAAFSDETERALATPPLARVEETRSGESLAGSSQSRTRKQRA